MPLPLIQVPSPPTRSDRPAKEVAEHFRDWLNSWEFTRLAKSGRRMTSKSSSITVTNFLPTPLDIPSHPIPALGLEPNCNHYHNPIPLALVPALRTTHIVTMPTTIHLRGASLRALLSTTSARRIVGKESVTAATNDPPSSRTTSESCPYTGTGADALTDEVPSSGAGDGSKRFALTGSGRVVRPPASSLSRPFCLDPSNRVEVARTRQTMTIMSRSRPLSRPSRISCITISSRRSRSSSSRSSSRRARIRKVV